MRAAWYDRKGHPHEVLEIGDLSEAAPGPNEVRVRVHVSGVNPSDTKNRSGWGGNLSMPFARIVPHNDGAGVIDAIGAGVAEKRLGQRVWVFEAQRDGRAFGTAAESVVVPEHNAVVLPEGVGFDIGASLGVPAMTAHRALFIDGAIAGQTVLVSGAGAVADCAVQLAKWAGATVISTVGTDLQVQQMRVAGADHVVNYKTDDVAARVRALTDGAGVDRVVEVAFEANLATDLAVLKSNGVIATYASGRPDSAPTLPFYDVLMQGLTIHFVFVYLMPAAAHAAAARDITAALSIGPLKPRVGRRFSLDQIADAHVAQDDGSAGGKILIDLAPGDGKDG